jgi:peptidoglycan/LPS O-acetylase OafA/YrhL
MPGGSKPNFEPAASAARPEPRFRSLDGLRGLAALMVALCHFLTAFQASIMDGNPATAHFAAAPALSHMPLILLYNPELCVSIFFILSGFVLASSVVESGAPLHAVIARRWVRLALPVMAAFIFAFAVPALGLNFSQAAAVWSKSNWLALQYTGITRSLSEFARGLAESAIVLMYMSYGWHTLTLVLVSPADGWGNLVRRYNFNLWTMPIEFAGSIALFIFYRIFLIPLPCKRLVRLAAVAALLAYLWKTPFFGFPAGMALFECYRLAGAVRFPRSGRAGAIAPAATAFVIGGLLFVTGLVLGGCPFELNMSAGAFYKTIALAL